MTEAAEINIKETIPIDESAMPPEPVIEASGRLAILHQLNPEQKTGSPAATKFDGAAIRRRVKSRAQHESSSLDPVRLYLREIGRHPVLKAEEERELSRQIEDGRVAEEVAEATGMYDESVSLRIEQARQARERFINSNLRLVVSIAKRYPIPPSMDLLDLIQEGNLGLEHAVDKFDWRKGFKFSTYASWWIRQGIGRGIDNKANSIRLRSGWTYELRAALEAVGGDEERLDSAMGQLWGAAHPVSLDYSPDSDSKSSLLDHIKSPEDVEDEAITGMETSRIFEWLNKLPNDSNRIALIERYGLTGKPEKTYREIGEILGLDSEKARRLVIRSSELLAKIASQ